MEDKVSYINSDGKEIECEILSIINKGDIYIFYREIINKQFTLDIFCSKAVAYKDNQFKLIPLTDEEWKLVDEEYKMLIRKINIFNKGDNYESKS